MDPKEREASRVRGSRDGRTTAFHVSRTGYKGITETREPLPVPLRDRTKYDLQWRKDGDN